MLHVYKQVQLMPFQPVNRMRSSRYLAAAAAKTAKVPRGFVFGVHDDGSLTAPAASNAQFSQALASASKRPGFEGKVGNVQMVWSQDGVPAALVGLGASPPSTDDVRKAAASGYKAMLSSVDTVVLDSLGDARAAAEGATLASYSFDALKRPEERLSSPTVEVLEESLSDQFEAGRIVAEAQNFARTLADTPANLMTPRLFCAALEDALPASVERTFHERQWIEAQKMGAFLSVARGSDEAPLFAELSYRGDPASDQVSLCLVGKGVTFDSGGVSIKPSAGMAAMKGDMGGAASVAGAMLGISRLALPINVTAVMPLCENMVNGSATKPGDVVTARSGLSIEVDNTDAEGRMLLADALDYSIERFSPKAVVDLATLTGAMVVALGDAAIGTFANDDNLWKELQQAGENTGETLWRMPLMKRYGELMKSDVADLINSGTSRQAGSCTATAFLERFVKEGTCWSHIDIAAVMDKQNHRTYLSKGMSGMPTRTLIEFARNKQ